MSNYYVPFYTYASAGVEVEAESVEEAIEKAWDAFDGPSLCHHCSNGLDLNGDWEMDHENIEDPSE